MAPSRILVVDDEPHVRSLIGAALERSEYQPVLAASATEALLHMERDEPYDLVLSDMMMKGIDGLGLLDRIKLLQPQTPVVMVTAMHDIGTAINAMRRGAYDYLLKPFEKEQLLTTVRRALDYRQLILENTLYQQNLEELVSARTNLLRQAMVDLERSYDITLEALGDALDLKDSETEGHSKRVTAFTIALARATNLSADRIRVIARGAFLHDIGKMAIPDAILLKPGMLDRQEQSVMRGHCARGYHIVRKIPFLQEAAEIVYTHQEHWNGSGYPRGLKGDQIPLGARIFAVADTLDAITSNRPYRTARSFEEARREILRCAGTQFDPSVVTTFLGLPDQLWEDLRSAISAQARNFYPTNLADGESQIR